MIDISPRVQRLIVRSFSYLPFKVVYKKGIDIPVADTLSHVTPMDPEGNIKLPIIAVNMITTRILMSTDCKGSLPTDLHEFWPHKEMLSIKSGLITCGNRIIVPREM